MRASSRREVWSLSRLNDWRSSACVTRKKSVVSLEDWVMYFDYKLQGQNNDLKD